MSKYLFYTFLILFNFFCSPKPISVALSFTRETECILNGADGRVTILCWGYGINKEAASENAITNGLNDIVFKGIQKGKINNQIYPLISDQNIKKDHEKYFQDLFLNNYKSYVVISEITKPTLVSNNQKLVKVELIVNVAELKRKMYKDLNIKS
jgi:hypothetical protein